MALKISQLTPVAAGSLDGSEPVELGIAGDKSAPNGAFLPSGYIDGLKMVWVSGTALTVTSGAAYIPSLGRVVRANAAVAKAGLVLTASTWYHVYLYLNGGVPDIEIVTTAPAAAYAGTARTKTGDTSRRYVGSVRTDGSGAIYAFKHQPGGLIAYMANSFSGAPFVVLSGGVATTPTTLSLADNVPITSQAALLSTRNTDTSIPVLIGTSDQGYALSAGAFQFPVEPSAQTLGVTNTDASQAIQYMFRTAGVTGTFNVRCIGYTYER